MRLYFHLLERGEYEENITHVGSSYILHYPCGNNRVECTPYYSYLPAGNYIFEVWGAQGGFSGGKGGYSIGLITLYSRTLAYITIGAEGSQVYRQNDFTTTAYNGGGYGHADHGIHARSAGSGGGSTDIKLEGNSNEYRCIVAGGGGGRCEAYGYNVDAGYGGGDKGGNSENGLGGTQEYAHTVGANIGAGEFGNGGSASSEDGTAGGGGGGWYGGSTGKQGTAGGGAGGSGYVLHYSSHKPANYMLNNTKYYFKYWNLMSGNEKIPKCSDELLRQNAYETGHSGFGCARITILPSLSLYTKKQSFYQLISLRCFLFMYILFK